MKSIMLIGLGRFGTNMAKTLYELGHEVLAVDLREERVNDVMPYVLDGQIGDSTDENFLASLGVRNFDVCFVAIGDNFQSSLVTTAILKDLGASKIVARASSAIHEKILLRNGADAVVYPEKQLAHWTAIRYSLDHVLDYIAVDQEYSIFELRVPEKWAGKSIGKLNIRQKHKVNILGIRRGEELEMNISSDTILYAEDTLLVLGRSQDIQRIFRLLSGGDS